MGRQVVADCRLEAYLKSLCKLQEVTVGLIIGQPALHGKDVVVHLVKTSKKTTDKVDSVAQVDTAEVVDHALNVLKCLPGGFYVFGVFFISPKDIFSEASNSAKIKSLIVNLRNNLRMNATLLGDTDKFDDGDKLLLWYSSSNNSCICKAMSADGGKGAQLRSVDWKFVSNAVQWVMLETFFEIDETFQLMKSYSNTDAAIQEPLDQIKSQIEDSQIFFNGTPMEKGATLESLVQGKKLKEVKPEIYRSIKKCEPVTSYSHIESVIKFRGTLCSRVWAPTKMSTDEVSDFIKNDIIRSLGVRLQILTDSLVDDKLIQNEVLINEPPRRVYYPIQIEPIQFCEYLFPNELPKTIVTQIKENMDMDLKADQIQSNAELVAESTTVVEKAHEVASTKTKNNDNSKIYVFGVVAALIILTLSILIHNMIK